MLPFPTHLTTILIKAYLSISFSQYIISCLPFDKKLQDILKGKRHSLRRHNNYQNKTQISAGVLELSDHECKTTMVNMLKALMDQVDNIQW